MTCKQINIFSMRINIIFLTIFILISSKVFGWTDELYSLEEAEVIKIQTKLNNLGYDIGKIDGKLGIQTNWALIAYGDRTNTYNIPSVLIDRLLNNQEEAIPCPVNNRFAQPAGKISVSIKFWGYKPADYLSQFYERVAECSPDTLMPVLRNIELKDIFNAAYEIGSLPKEEVTTYYQAFEDAVLTLTDKKITKENFDEYTGGYYIPGTKVKLKNENVSFYIKLSDAPNLMGSAEYPSEVFLNSICSNMGYKYGCITSDNIRQKDKISSYEGNKENYLPKEYYTYLDHFEIILNFEINDGSDLLYIEDGIAQVVQNNKSMQGYNGSYAPVLNIDNLFHPDSDLTNGICNYSKDTLKSLIDNIGWEPETKQEKNEIYDPVDILVVEPGIESSDPVRINNLNHEYTQEIVVSKPNFLVGRNVETPNFGKDKGHYYHVSHIIGAKGQYDGWTGLAPSNNIFLVNFETFLEILEEDHTKIASDHSGKNQFRIHNFSMTLGSGQCTPLDAQKNLSAEYEYLNEKFTDINNELSSGFYVFASSVLQESIGDLQCDYNENSNPKYFSTICKEISCLGAHENSISVAPLDSNLTAVREDSRLADSFKYIAAPGTNIFSADVENDDKGYRARCGSSHAAPIVAATAARIAKKYVHLKPHEIKSRLVAGVTLSNNSSLYGVLNIKRSVESDPAEVTIWMDSGEKKTGSEIKFYNGGFSQIERAEININQQLISLIKVKPQSPEENIKFQAVYQVSSTDRNPKLSDPFQFELNKFHEHLCSLSKDENGNYHPRPCAKLLINDDPITWMDIEFSKVSHIIMKSFTMRGM